MEAAILDMPQTPRALAVLAHGAGAGMRHPFLHHVATRLAARGIAVYRYEYPYMEARNARPDPPAILHATVRAAVTAAAAKVPGVPVVAGGKSMGGRMTSGAQAAEPIPGVRGIFFLGFPLHPAGRPSRTRADHLRAISIPMLFVQGTRDALAPLDAITAECEALGKAAALHVVEGGDHSFSVLKRSGRSAAEVMLEIENALVQWIDRVAIQKGSS